MKLFSIIAVIAAMLIMAPLAFGKVIVLFDEDSATEAGAGDFAALFGSHDAGSVVEISSAEKYTGSVSAFCSPQQSYNNIMTGWTFPIDETPYMTIAWKKDGGAIIMIQMAFDETWAYRYYEGDNSEGVGPTWEGLQVGETIPEDWRMFTRNLTEDFAAGWNLTGLAFTPWDGNGGYYDHMVLSTTEEEGQTAVAPSGKTAATWGDIKVR